MALNINKTANQINEFANEFKKSYSEHSDRIDRARQAYIDWANKSKNIKRRFPGIVLKGCERKKARRRRAKKMGLVFA